MSAPLRILLDMHALGENRSGNETYIKNLARHAIQVGAKEFRFHLAFGRGEDQDAFREFSGLRPGSDFDSTLLNTRRAVRRLAWTFPRLLARESFDVAHFQYVLPARLPRDTRFVISIHDMSYRAMPEHYTSRHHVIHRAIDTSTRRADHVLTISDFSRGEILRTYPYLDPANVTNAGGAVDTDVFKPDPEPRRHLAGLEARLDKVIPGSFVLSVGNLQPRKNIPRLLRAFERLRVSEPDARLVLVGQRGWKDQGVMDALARGDGSVVWTDWVSPEELVALYSACRLFVYPSLYEGFGLPVLEAVACGAPVLTSRGSSLQEICPIPEALVDPESTDDLAAHMASLLRCDDALQALREKQTTLGARFSWRATAEKTLAVYRRVAGARHSSRVHPSSSSSRETSSAK